MNVEKIHSGGSTDSYFLRSIVVDSIPQPNICMPVKLDDFFLSLLQKRAVELVTLICLCHLGFRVGQLQLQPEFDSVQASAQTRSW